MDSDDKERYYDHLPIWTGGNAFFNGAKPCDREKDAYIDEVNEITWELTADGTFKTNLYDYLPKMDNPVISTEVLGMTFEPEQKFENSDGTPILFQRDYFDNARGLDPYSGPLANTVKEINLLEM